MPRLCGMETEYALIDERDGYTPTPAISHTSPGAVSPERSTS